MQPRAAGEENGWAADCRVEQWTRLLYAVRSWYPVVSFAACRGELILIFRPLLEAYSYFQVSGSSLCSFVITPPGPPPRCIHVWRP